MSKTAVARLRALIGKPVALYWMDATCHHSEPGAKVPLYQEATIGYVDFVDEEQIKLRMGRQVAGPDGNKDSDSADSSFAMPLGWVRWVVLLQGYETWKITSKGCSVSKAASRTTSCGPTK